MHQMHFLYQYSLQFFLDMFNSVLNGNPKLTHVKDYSTRLDIITKDLFQVCSQRVTRGILHIDRLSFAILLARIFTKGSFEQAFQMFLRFKEGVFPLGKNSSSHLTLEHFEGLSRLKAKVPSFKGVMGKVDNAEFGQWIRSPSPESNVPIIWEESGEEEFTKTVYKMLIIQAVRPDRVVAMGHILVDEVLGLPPEDVNLGSIVETEVTSRTPILLCSAPGFDASGRVDDLAAQMNQTLVSIAIGSAEGFTQADQSIASAVKTGRWVLLKNVHLAPQWLLQLEKKLHSYDVIVSKNSSKGAKRSASGWSWKTFAGKPVCDTKEIKIVPGWAKNEEGEWLVILQTEQWKQEAQISLCANSNNENNNESPKCVQRFTAQRLVVLDPENEDRCPVVRSVFLPSACVCLNDQKPKATIVTITTKRPKHHHHHKSNSTKSFLKDSKDISGRSLLTTLFGLEEDSNIYPTSSSIESERDSSEDLLQNPSNSPFMVITGSESDNGSSRNINVSAEDNSSSESDKDGDSNG